jgi:NADH-quinone oxidoreductase subunit I
MGLVDVIKKGVFFDILRGMSVTGTYFVSEKVTVEYPKEKLHTYPRFRGVHALLTDPETGDTKCVACMLCATICPSRCIHITGEVTPEGRSHPATFELDLARCVFCGLCEEVCPVAAIVMTRFYEGSTYDKRDFLLTKEMLMANQAYAHKEVFVEPATDARGMAPPLGRGGAEGAEEPPAPPAGADGGRAGVSDASAAGSAGEGR